MLLDLDGVLYVEDEPVPGAAEAVERMRAAGLTLRFVTNTTSHSRAATLQKLGELGFEVGDEELITPALLAVQHCRARGHRRVALLMADEVKLDFAELEEAERWGGCRHRWRPRRALRVRRPQPRVPRAAGRG